MAHNGRIGAARLAMIAGVAIGLLAPTARGQLYDFDFDFGASGTGEGQFTDPYGVALDGAGNIYVADTGNNRIQVFDSTGVVQFTFGWGVADGTSVFQICTSGCQAGLPGNGNGQLTGPRGVTIDHTTGRIYVADSGNNFVQTFESDGTYVSKFGDFFNLPNDIAVRPGSPTRLYVTDNNNRIKYYDLELVSGNVMGSGTFGTGIGRLTGVALDGSGNVYVADSGSNRIQVYDTNHNLQLQFGSVGSGDGQFDSPHGITIDGAGRILVTDGNNARVQIFDGGGIYVSQFGTGGSGDGQFNAPHAIDVDGAGKVYVADRGNVRVQVFAPAPSVIPTVGQWGLIALAVALLGGLIVILRRQTTRSPEAA